MAAATQQDGVAGSCRIAEHCVLVAGGGPTGLMLAGELALAGVDVAIVERRASQEIIGSRAGGLHARTIEILDQRGLAGRFLAEGQVMQVAAFAGVTLDISDFPTRHNYGLALGQSHIERILAEWVSELAVPIYRGREITGLSQDETGVDLQLLDGQALRARFVAGCDGGRSTVRKAAGIGFPGIDATVSNLIAEVELSEEPEWGLRRDARGLHAITRLDGGEKVRVLVTEQDVGTSEPTLRDLSEALVAAYGTDFGVHSPTWISRFTDATRQAAAYRVGRVLLAGDAAHVHPPDGGQGLQLGIHDAANLGWKLAQVVHGSAPEALLDTYHIERHAAAARVLETVTAATVLRRPDPRTKALHGVVSSFLEMSEARRKIAGIMSGLDICYPGGGGHPLIGRRMPDLELHSSLGRHHVYQLLHCARPVLVNFGQEGSIRVDGWTAKVQLVDATFAGAWELPVIGNVVAPSAVLVRPDGYVAWVGEGGSAGLEDALATWFGPPVPSNQSRA